MKQNSCVYRYLIRLIVSCLVVILMFDVDCYAQTISNSSSSNVVPAEAKVKLVNGYPQLFINGIQTVPVMPFVNNSVPTREVSLRQLKLAAEKGNIHLHHVILSAPMTNAKGEFDLTELERSLDLVREADPEGFVFLRLSLADQYNPKFYDESQRVRFTNGEVTDMISMASDEWEGYVVKELQSIVKFVLANPDYARMVVAYHLTAGETGEWFQYLHRENGVDISEANTRKFREWLVAKYKNADELRRNWQFEDVNFETAQIPSDYLGQGFHQLERTLYDKPTDRRILDYIAYYNEMTANRIVSMAKVMKEATNRKSLVGAFYGYTFELPDAKSGHYALKRVLESPDIDFLDGPVSYNNRNEGGVGASMSLVESIHAHGKMWFDECDYRSPIITADTSKMEGWQKNDPMPSIKTFDGLIEIYRRQMGFQMLKGNGGWAMDLMAKGWYDEARFWKEMKSLKEIYSKYEKIRPVSAPEVALIVDEEGLAMAADALFNMQMLVFLRDELYKTGVNFGIYLRSDLEKDLVPSAKIYFMVGAFRMNPETVDKLKTQLQQPGKTTVWIYGFGTTNPAGIQNLAGMQIKDSGKSLVPEITPTIALKTFLPEIGSSNFGTGVKESPVWEVQNAGPEITILGTTSGQITFALSKVNGSNQIFYGSNVLKADMLRALARFSGANIFNEGGWDACVANSNLVVIHTATAGKRIICFPRKVDVYEQYSGKWYSKVDSINLNVPAAKTFVFYYGNKSKLIKSGISEK